MKARSLFSAVLAAVGAGLVLLGCYLPYWVDCDNCGFNGRPSLLKSEANQINLLVAEPALAILSSIAVLPMLFAARELRAAAAGSLIATGALTIGFFAWFLVSFGWTASPGGTAGSLGAFVLVVAGAVEGAGIFREVRKPAE